MVPVYKLISKVQHVADVTPDILPLKNMQKIFELWLQAAKDRSDYHIPDKADLDFLQYADMLGNIALVRFDHDPFRAKYLVVGGELVSLYGEELSGRYVDELYGKTEREEAMGVYLKICTDKKPLYSKRTYKTFFRELGYNRLVLPYTDGGKSIEYAMTCIYPTNPSIKKASDWMEHDDIQYWLKKMAEEEGESESFEGVGSSEAGEEGGSIADEAAMKTSRSGSFGHI